MKSTKNISVIFICFILILLTLTGCQSEEKKREEIITSLSNNEIEAFSESYKEYNEKHSETKENLVSDIKSELNNIFDKYIDTSDFSGLQDFLNKLNNITPGIVDETINNKIDNYLEAKEYNLVNDLIKNIDYITKDIVKGKVDAIFETLEYNKEYDNAKEYIENIYSIIPDISNEEVLNKINSAPNAPSFSIENGQYYNQKEVKLNYEGNLKVYYSTDGTNPDNKSKKYGKYIPLNSGDNEIKVIAYNEWGNSSDVITGMYKNYTDFEQKAFYSSKFSYFDIPFYKDLKQNLGKGTIKIIDEYKNEIPILNIGRGFTYYKSLIISPKENLDDNIKYTITIPAGKLIFEDGDVINKEISIKIN